MAKVIDIFGRPVEEGDKVIFLEPKAHPFDVKEIRHMAVPLIPGGPPVAEMRLGCEIGLPLDPNRPNPLPIMIVMKAIKTSSGQA